MSGVLAHCNAVRRSVPYTYWLIYDCVIVVGLLYGLSLSPAFWAGVPFVALAVFCDAVEFVVKTAR